VRYVAIITAVIGLLAAQMSLLQAFGVTAYSVDLTLLAVLYLAATSPVFGGFVASVVLGLVSDAFTPGGILGMNMEIMGILFLVGRGLAERLQMLHPAPLMLVVLVGMVTKVLLVFLFSIVFDREFTTSAVMFLNAIPHVLTTALLAPVMIALFGWVDRRWRRRRPSHILR